MDDHLTIDETASDSRLASLVHYVCARGENPGQLGATKLNKVLWLSDVLAYSQLGATITGATYVRRQFGPVPKRVMNARAQLKAAGALIERASLGYRHQQIQLIALTLPDISMFLSDQISIIDSVMDAICFGQTTSIVSALSRDFIWELAEIGEEIPVKAAAFGAHVGELDEDDVKWATDEVTRHEGSRGLS